MKNKIYPFLLGLSCIVIVALVSFKNSEKEHMIIIVQGMTCTAKDYEIFVSTGSKYERIKSGEKETLKFVTFINKLQEYQKEGWVVINSNAYTTGSGGAQYFYYALEK